MAALRQLAAKLLLVCAASGLPSAAATSKVADTILTNARIYTGDARHPWAEAIAILDGKIVAVGRAQEIASYSGVSTRWLDARQHLVLPGLTDSHIHFYEGSLRMVRLRLSDAQSARQLQQSIKQYAVAHPEEPWILGGGWSYPAFPGSGMPDRKLLDEVLPDRPALLEAFDGHTYWANSKALELAGIRRGTSDPPNGAIVRDEHGDPTGALKEDAAANLVRRVIPEPSREQKIAALRRGLQEANRVGIVRVHCAGGEGESNDFPLLDLLENLAQSHELTVRFYVAYYLDPAEPLPAAIKRAEAARKHYADDWISTGAVKTYLDGVVEAHTAAMLDPYTDDPAQSGKVFWDPEQYKAAVAQFDRRGFQVFTHAIGDRAVRLALDAYENARASNHTADARHRVEHIETISAQDIPRFGRLGVIASYQPLHAYPNENVLSVWTRRVGPERASRGWAWRSVAGGGGTLAFGSDWPVVTINPWEGIQTAVTRQTWDGTPAGGWQPQERVSLEQAIRAYTLGAAVAGHREKTEGSLEPGKLADLIVVSQDLFKIDPHQLRRTEVLLTMVGGKVVYQSPAWEAPAQEEKR